MSGAEPMQARFLIPADAHISLGGAVYRYKGRARDTQQKHLFVSDDGLPVAFGDNEFLKLSQQVGVGGRPALRIMTSAELAASKSEKKVNWRSLFDRATEVEKARVRNVAAFIAAWDLAGRPSKTAPKLVSVIEAASRTHGLSRISPATLRRALKRWDGTLDSLVVADHLKGNKTPRADEQAWLLHQELAFKAYYSPERFDVPAVHAAVEQGFRQHNADRAPGAPELKPLSRSTTYRMLKTEGSFVADFTRRDSRQAARDHRAVGKAPQEPFANSAWEVDASPQPVILLEDTSVIPVGRAVITLALDSYSRAVMGFDISWRAESLRSIASALGMGILPKEKLLSEAGLAAEYPMKGMPGRIVADHASHTGLKAQQFKLLCERIGCEPSNTRVAMPSDKGKIERMLRTYFFKVCHCVPGSTFSDIFERNKEKVPERVAVCTISEMRRLTLRFIVEIYHRRLHRGLGTAPNLAFAASMATRGIAPPPDPQRLVSMLSVPFVRTVQAYGLEVMGLRYNSEHLMEYRQTKTRPEPVSVFVDPNDVARAWWIDPRDGEERSVFLAEPDRKYRGWTIGKYELIRALQRNNPELMASDAAARQAYSEYVRDLMAIAKTDGLEKRRKALRKWEALRKQARRAFNDDVEDPGPRSGDLLDPLFETDGMPNPAEAVPRAAEPPAESVMEAAERPVAKSARARRSKPASKPGLRVAVHPAYETPSAETDPGQSETSASDEGLEFESLAEHARRLRGASREAKE